MNRVNTSYAETRDLGSSTSQLHDAPVVRFVNQLLLDAVKKGASDIHLEPYEHQFRIRFRVDGLLRETESPASKFSGRIASRIKIMAHMDISEKRLPQDGQIKLQLSDSHTIELRISTLPTRWGEKVVIRMFDASRVRLDIHELGFSKNQKNLYLQGLHRSQGLVLVTGPTGSGKTVTLYTGLNLLNTLERNISTAEEPIEINLEGINQVAVNPKIGLSFAGALRAFLRQDPDVLMVGEIRDAETAEIAIQAAQTGHLVLSTLHTNSAAETVSRLRQMGIPNFNLATSINLIIAQRLSRRLCPHCKQEGELPASVLKEQGFRSVGINAIRIFKPLGCAWCQNGYQGRLGIYEVVPMTQRLTDCILTNGNASELAREIQRAGFPNLREAALNKVKEGVISLEEANRLTSF